MNIGISAVVIALNEGKNIGPCLETLSWADEVIVIDSGSEDSTARIAAEKGAKVYPRQFDDFTSQRNFAIDMAREKWILFVDADERVTSELAQEIREAIDNGGQKGYELPRKNYIFGREMRYGGHQGDRHLRLFLREGAKYSGVVHEKANIDGSIGVLMNPLLHYSTPTIEEYFRKLEFYSDLEAELLLERYGPGELSRASLLIKPMGRFVKQYFFQLGFLDGFRGFEFYVLSAYNVYLKYKKFFYKVDKSEEVGSL